DKDPAAAEYAVFGAALACRLSPAIADEANLYLTRFEVPQIHLFNLLAHEVPQVRLTTVIANRCLMQGLMQGLANQAHCTIIDIGLGAGRQMIELLAMMRAAPTTHSRRVTLIGIDPSASSLALARENLRNVAERLGMVVDFH